MEEQRRTQENRAGPGEAQCPWIEDEGLLRDEGVVFGLMRTPGALTEKEAAIRAFHRRRMAEEARRRQSVEAELAALLQRHALDADARRAPAPSSAEVEAEGHAAGGLVARDVLGFAVAVMACVGTAVFVYEQIWPHFWNPALVTAGVVGAGFFTTFLPVSLLFTGDDARRAGSVELWKVRLAEFGLPLVAALFVVAWSLDRLGPLRAAATGALLFLAFTFAGRQALSTVPRLGSSLRALRRERAGARPPRDALEESVAALRRELAALRSADEWEAICDTRLAIFRSEYELAAARSGPGASAPLAQPIPFTVNRSH